MADDEKETGPQSARPEPPRPPVAAAAPVPALTYERPPAGPITRGHVRWVLALATAFLLMTVQKTYLPDVRVTVNEWWAARKEAAAKAAAVKQVRDVERRAMDFVEPPAKVVWEEDPDAAAKLVAGAGYRWLPVGPPGAPDLADRFFVNWPRGAKALHPPILAQVMPDTPPDADAAIAVLHGFRTAAGAERLVYVYVLGRETPLADRPSSSGGSGLFGSVPAPADSVVGPADERWSRPLRKTQGLAAVVCVPGNGEGPPKPLDDRTTELTIHPYDDPQVLSWTYTPGPPGKPGKLYVPWRDRLRVFAGQPDPADAAHFTIAYDVDGQPGVIHGRLKDDDTVELRPTTGTVVGDRWYPHGK